MVGVRCVAVAAPGFAPGARDPGFTPAAFGGECFYDLYLAVDEGAEGGAAGADHADGEFELTICVSLSEKASVALEGTGALTSRLRCSRGCR